MLPNIGKVVINYKKYSKFLSFSQDNFGLLFIEGFFGKVSLKVPKKFFIEIDKENIILYFDLNKLSIIKKNLKSFYFLIIFSCYGLVYNHFVYMTIKGIGFKFKLEENFLVVYSGNSLPTYFKVPSNLKILDNSSSNNFSVFSGDFIFLNNFVTKVRNIAVPNKYKEIGIYLEKKL
jgi:ribosomal protein L6P/L9E